MAARRDLDRPTLGGLLEQLGRGLVERAKDAMQSPRAMGLADGAAFWADAVRLSATYADGKMPTRKMAKDAAIGRFANLGLPREAWTAYRQGFLAACEFGGVREKR